MDSVSEHTCGDFTGSVFQPLSAGGDGFALQFPQSCTSSNCKRAMRTSTINFYCDKSDGKFEFVNVENKGGGNYNYIFQWKTSHACPVKSGGGGGGGGGSAISGGWIFIIILFSLVILYFVCGALWNRFKLDKRGIEIIPNHEFWLSLPGLVKDGHIYVFNLVCRLIGRCTSRSYEQV